MPAEKARIQTFLLNSMDFLKNVKFSTAFHASTVVATITILGLIGFKFNAVPSPQVFSVTIKTCAPQNELVTIWYRIPKNYHPRQGQMSHWLVLFDWRKNSGKGMVSIILECGTWDDGNNAFLVSSGAKTITTGNWGGAPAWCCSTQ